MRMLKNIPHVLVSTIQDRRATCTSITLHFVHCKYRCSVSCGRYTDCMNCSLTRKEELAAVIVPWGLMNAAFSLLICSMVDGLIPLSLTTVSATPVNNKGRTETSSPLSKYMYMYLIF